MSETAARNIPAKSASIIAKKILARAGVLMLLALAVVIFTLLGVIWVLVKGPSPTARQIFVISVNETSAVGWLSDIFLSRDEVEGIIAAPEPVYDINDTDTSLIKIPAAPAARPPAAGIDAGGDSTSGSGAPEDNTPAALTSGDDDGDGMEMVEISGNGYTGYMLIVDDPGRIFLGTPDSYGGAGLRLEQIVDKYGAVAGINGGGFADDNGLGRGGTPNGFVITDGEIIWGAGSSGSVVGFDADGILHVGNMSAKTALESGIMWACTFGPVLISNGIANDNASFLGVNPRTAIGQREDGAVLMLVVNGRQINSLGASLRDLVEIMLDFGAVNAANLDGGNSSQMILYGETINNLSSTFGNRPLPNAFLVGG